MNCYDARMKSRMFPIRSLTDESVLVERLGSKIVTVEGSSRNIKITRQEDLAIGEAILRTVGSDQ